MTTNADEPTGPAVQKTDDEWQETLTPTQYQVMRCHGTEMRGTSPLNKEKRAGMYRCAACGTPLFSSDAKFESGTGWPSFDAPLEGGVETSVDRSHLMTRTEVHCRNCGGHLGHVFPDGPRDHERAIRFDDPAIGIEWPMERPALILSAKDRNAPLLADTDTGF